MPVEGFPLSLYRGERASIFPRSFRMPHVIPEEVKTFLADNINSIAELEALLLLREERHRRWTSPAVAERIYTDEPLTLALLLHLTHRGFLTADDRTPPTFQYQPRNQPLSRLLDQLAEAYAKYLVPVTALVHQKSRRNIEGFADAFKFTKET